jgi:hypothetical protein
MFQQIYTHIEMPHDEQLRKVKRILVLVDYLKKIPNLLSFVTARLRTRSDLFPTRIIGI